MEKLRLFRDDIMVTIRTTNTEKLTGSGLYIPEQNDTDFEYYDVLEVGPDCVAVKKGDVVMMSWARMTPPFKVGDQKVSVTSEKEAFAVVEDLE